MAGEQTQQGDDAAVERSISTLLEPMRVAFSDVAETGRYRMLATLLNHLADEVRAGADGRAEAAAEQTRVLAKKSQDLARENADLQDRLRILQADLSRRELQLEAETARGRELTGAIEDYRGRQEAMQKELDEAQTQLVARNHDVHQFEVERDSLRLKLQRLELKASDRSQVDTLEEGKRDLSSQIEELQTEVGRVRAEKDAQIDDLRVKLRDQVASKSQSADALLMKLWDRLASVKPTSLVQGGIQPTLQSAENLIDSFIEMAIFTHKLDQDMRVFLNRYTRHHAALSRQWQVYSAREDFNQAIQQTIAPQSPKQVGVFRLKLKAFHKFSFAAMVSSDAVIESIASELQTHLMGEHGAGSDPNLKIRDYIRNDCHELFMDHIKTLRSEKMSEVFIRG